MKIWNTVFIVLIILLSIFTWIYGGKALLIRREWSTGIKKLQKQIDSNKDKLKSVLEGVDSGKPRESFHEFSEMSVGELINKLDVMAEDRGNAWFGCKPLSVDENNIVSVPPRQLGDDNPSTPDNELKPLQLITISVEIISPVDNENPDLVIPPEKLGGVFYVFDEGNNANAGAFLGRFTINEPPMKKEKNYAVTLKSATELKGDEINFIKSKMKSTWAIYSTMPRDRYDDIFDRIKKEDIDRIVPEEEMRKNLTKADRNLTDFDVVLTAGYLRNVKLNQRKELFLKNIADLKISIAQMSKETKDVQFAIELENKRIALMKDQINAVQKVLDGYNVVIERIKESIIKTQQQNDWYAAKIADYNLKSLQIIEQKAESAAKNIE
ncbi:MAG: hypothetical protein LBB88_08490 [Planctomycetaceae bacterium]|jgi:hypothetical protein|nr:hypothetical protein [Planctomycetaceae bacterium]